MDGPSPRTLLGVLDPDLRKPVFCLQMYGEKVEEAEELRLDLLDVKEMYKIQIEEVLKQQH